ncbi:V-type ATP synthase subunit A [bacterium]|nr:MAG: V-type ATP synthase subunit A [bacterium]
MSEEKIGRIVKVSGPLVVAENMTGAKMYDVVRVSDKHLVGEIIELVGDTASIQVYEETGGLGPGEPVYLVNMPLSVELGPGLLTSIYDGIQRPLDIIVDKTGDFITRGVTADPLPKDKKWDFVPKVEEGQKVTSGDIIGTVQETVIIEHRIPVPPGISGMVEKIESGEHTIEDIICVIKDDEGKEHKLKMYHRWPARTGRPYKKKYLPEMPLLTGQRPIDTFFPVGKGGTACVPGPFGSGKTVIQHQLAKWADADVIIYVGCGERGNEMTDVLNEFPELKDPKTGEPLMLRTVLIANTSNMPVAAREASVYTGITIAEYFRDMGYSVALMADSTSRWAEAMREISGRLEEMPGEEGYPAYLGRRIAEFYERAGWVENMGTETTTGALTVIGAVSPPGGDLADPVVQATLRVVRVFWSLEAELAYQRHYPAISWINSYSLYGKVFDDFYRKNYPEFPANRDKAMAILQTEAELSEIVKLVGAEALDPSDRLTLEAARSIREDYLQQDAFHEVDTYCSAKKQDMMLKAILEFEEEARKALERGAPFDKIESHPIREEIARVKYVEEKEALKRIDSIIERLPKAMTELVPEEVGTST